MMRRTVLLLVSTALALVAVGGIALAATITCTTNPCDGTPDDDLITGTLNAETINGQAGNDTMHGEPTPIRECKNRELVFRALLAQDRTPHLEVMRVYG